MTDPLVNPDQLASYLSDPSIDTARAALMLNLATTACSVVVSPLPAAAVVVVMRVAARGYVSTLSTRRQQMIDAGSPLGGSPYGGIYLTDQDEVELRRMSTTGTGGGGAFSVDLLPTGYLLPVPGWYEAGYYPWDVPS